MKTFTMTNTYPSYASFDNKGLSVPSVHGYSSYHNVSKKYSEEPNIKTTVEIKKVPDYSDSGRFRKKWGLELTVGKEKIQVPVGNKAQLMIYVCTLLRIRNNERLYLHEFYNNSQGRKSPYQLKSSRVWLKSVYNFLYRYESRPRPYEDWEKKNQDMNDLGRPLHQGKGRLNDALRDALQGQPEYIVEKFLLNSVSKKRDTYYDIKIRPQNIIVPEELKKLCGEFYGMM